MSPFIKTCGQDFHQHISHLEKEVEEKDDEPSSSSDEEKVSTETTHGKKSKLGLTKARKKSKNPERRVLSWEGAAVRMKMRQKRRS